jgi:hypothetical protein
MTYHASYEQAGRFGVAQFRVTDNGAFVLVESDSPLTGFQRLGALDPAAARWLANRLIEAAEEMEKA